MPRPTQSFFYILVAMVPLINGSNGQDSRYLGCFYDTLPRALPDLTACDAFRPFCNNFCSSNVPYCQSSTNMSVTNCLDLCSRQSHTYAGVQARTQCFCGGRTAPYDRYGEDVDGDVLGTCQSNCSGDPTQSCGNDYRMQIYEIGCLPIAAPMNSDVSPANEDFFAVGRNLSVACRVGFYLSGRGNLTCLPLGEWNAPAPSCLPDLCALPDPPPDTTARGNHSRDAQFEGGDSLLFDCSGANTTAVNLTCVNGDWQSEGVCPEMVTSIVTTEIVTTEIVTTEIVTTEIVTTEITEAPTDRTEALTSAVTGGPFATTNTEGVTGRTPETTSTHTVPEMNSTLQTQATSMMSAASEVWTTDDVKENTTTERATLTSVNRASTSWDETTVTSQTSTRAYTQLVNMLWLILIVGAAMCLFIVVVFIAVVIVCKRKSKRDESAINFQNDLQLPRVEDMSRMNPAYEETERPSQNGRHASDPPFRISTLYSQKEITVDNNNAHARQYAKPVTPACATGQSEAAQNEYVKPSRVHYHKKNGGVEPRGLAIYLPDLPEPDYAMSPRDPYVEVVTRL